MASDDMSSMLCGLCQKRYKDPRILDCFHSFCRECIDKYVAKKQAKLKFPCPMCNISISIPKSGIKGLKQNYYIKAIQASAAFSTFSKCDVCKSDEHPAGFRCLECESNLCESCMNKHFEADGKRDHHAVTLSNPEAKTITKLTHKTFCEKHKDEETCHYCILCEVPICKECVTKVSDHKGHRYKSIAEGAKEKREKVKPVIQSMHEYLPYLRDYVEELKSCRKLLGDYAEETITDIKARFNQLQDQLLKIRDDLIDDVTSKLNAEYSRIEKHLKQIETTLSSVRP
ncbi:hypothetical protein FSP39_014989 [Pinctada imbricata]|uniref:Uncharacterized protein n=1 Tax=Pinctada imbricata TaxID=66713 RepID=A0AA88Y904_PINIB|nr:hypothetical protein FSP39_014989 [Pinctada imbricata]